LSIVHVAEDLKTGGMEKVIKSLALGFAAAGHDVSVLCLMAGGDMADELRGAGIAVDILPASSPKNPLFINKIRKYFIARKASVVHAHGYPASVPARLAAIAARVPSIFYHVHTAGGPTGLRRRVKESILLKFTDGVICCSRAVADFAASSGAPSRKIQVVYNGVSRFGAAGLRGPARKEFGFDDDAFVFGTVCRLEPLKGVDVMIAAARLLAADPSAEKIRWLIVGDGSRADELKNMAARSGIADRVVFAGFRKDISGALAAMDAAALASREREGFSLFLAEAMSAGKPLIGTAVGGIPEVIVDGVNGLVVPSEAPSALAAAMLRVAGDEAFRRASSEASLRIYAGQFTEDRMISSVESLYRSRFAAGILYIHTYSGLVGGGEISFLNFLDIADRRRFRFASLLPRAGELSGRLEKSAATRVFYSLEAPTYSAAGFLRAPFYQLAIMRAILLSRPEILYCDTPRAGFFCGLASRLSGIPMIFHARTSESGGRLDRILHFFSRRIICSSSAAAARFKRFDGFESTAPKIRIIYNGVDIDKFTDANVESAARTRTALNIPSSAPLMGYCGQLVEGKGVDILLKAFSIVRNKIPSAVLAIAGSGAASSDLRARADNIGGVVFCGFLDDPRGFYAAVDVVVVPTMMKEGFSRSVIEGMSSGKAVVASAIGGNPEAITHGETGLLVPPGDENALAAALIRLLENDSERFILGKAARSRAIADFSILKHAEEIMKVYAEILDEQ